MPSEIFDIIMDLKNPSVAGLLHRCALMRYCAAVQQCKKGIWMSETREIVALLERFMLPLSEGVIVYNRDGTVLTVNAAVRRLFDIPVETR